MVDSINIPQNLAKVMEIKLEIKDTSEQLKRFLTDILLRLEMLETKVKTLEEQVAELTP